MNQADQQFIMQNLAALLRDNLGQRVNDTVAHGLLQQMHEITAKLLTQPEDKKE